MGCHGSFPKRSSRQIGRGWNPWAAGRTCGLMFRWRRRPWFVRLFTRRPSDGRRWRLFGGREWELWYDAATMRRNSEG
jgi:hypothetical protein